MTNEELLALNGKVACGVAGEPMEVIDITYGEGLKKDSYEVKLVCKAKGVLINPNNVNEGDSPFSEDLVVTYGQDADKEEKKLFFDTLNEYFNIQPPLEDTRDEDGIEPAVIRLLTPGEDGARDQIVGKKVFLRLKVTQNNPKYPPIVNGFPCRTKTQLSTESGDAAEQARKRMLEKVAKKKQQEQAMAEALGV